MNTNYALCIKLTSLCKLIHIMFVNMRFGNSEKRILKAGTKIILY